MSGVKANFNTYITSIAAEIFMSLWDVPDQNLVGAVRGSERTITNLCLLYKDSVELLTYQEWGDILIEELRNMGEARGLRYSG